MDRIDTIEQVLTEMSFTDHFRQVAIGSADQPDINRNRRVVANPDDAPLLQDSQKFRLQVIGEVPDLVKKE